MSAFLRSLGLAAGAALALACPGRAFAQNTDSFFFSDEAAMAAGAVAATTRDSGAIWYNPAGLGGVKRGQIDLSASAFGLRLRQVPKAFTLSYPSGPRSSDVSATSIVSAPIALGFLRHLSDTVTVGFGVFVTARDLSSDEAFWRTDDTVPLGGAPTDVTFKQRLDQNLDLSRYHAGPAIGWQVAPRLRVGAGLLGTYGTQTFFRQFLFEGRPTDAPIGEPTIYYGQNQLRYQASYLGVQPHLGVQWEATDHWRLGLVVRSPEVLLTGTLRSSALLSSQAPDAAGAAQPFSSVTLPARRSYSFGAIAPARAIAALAWADERAGWVSAEVDYQTPLKNDDFNVDAPHLVNARLGALRHLGPRLSIGAGLFTERAKLRKLDPETFLAERLDYYGATVGVQLRTALALLKNPQDDALVLSTTLALRYALGLGSVTGVSAYPVEGLPDRYRSIDVVYHEFIPYFGSSTTF